MADPGRRQQDRSGPPPARQGPVPAGTVPGRAAAGPPPGWVPAPPRNPRYPGQPPGSQFYPAQVRQGAPPGYARGPAPAQAPPGGRPGAPTQAVGPQQQRPRPPAGPAPANGRPPTTRPAPAPLVTTSGKKLVIRDVHSRRIIRKVDVGSVFKVSFFFYFCVLVVMIAAGVVLWNVAAAFGVITTLDKSIRSLFALKSFTLHPLVALEWGSIVGVLLCFLGILVNTMAAVFYNLISDLVGGIQVISLSDRERTGQRPPPTQVDGVPATSGPPTAATPNGKPRTNV